MTARAVLDRNGAETLLRAARDPARHAVEVNGYRHYGESSRVDALLGATEALFAAGDAQRATNAAAEALALTKSIDSTIQRAATLARVAESLGRCGRKKEASHWTDAALEVTLAIQDPDYATLRSARLARVALVLAELGRFEDAVKVARQIDKKEAHSLALAYVAEMMARAGEFAAARSTAAECSDADTKLAGYTAVVFEVAKRRIHTEHPLVQEFLESRKFRLMALTELPQSLDN